MNMNNNNRDEDSHSPKSPATRTQVVPDDALGVKQDKSCSIPLKGVTCDELEESVINVNPDVDSMDSRG